MRYILLFFFRIKKIKCLKKNNKEQKMAVTKKEQDSFYPSFSKKTAASISGR